MLYWPEYERVNVRTSNKRSINSIDYKFESSKQFYFQYGTLQNFGSNKFCGQKFFQAYNLENIAENVRFDQLY